MARAAVKDIDRGWAKLKAEMRRTNSNTVVAVGVQGPEATAAREDGINNATLASVHEFGSGDGRIPERSFIRATIDTHKDKYRELSRKLGIRVIEGKLTTWTALGLLGERVTADIKRRIQRGIDPELKEKTKERKGSSKQLIHTKVLLGSITHSVQQKTSSGEGLK
jgi:hypothetical protein